MREILFRGKTDDEKFVYGSLVVDRYDTPGGGGNLENGMKAEDCYITSGLKIYHNVDPETVGQFTGLLDKNGVEIFEGDIVKLINLCNKKSAEENDRMIFKVVYELVLDDRFSDGTQTSGFCLQKIEDREFTVCFLHSRKMVIIGNCHDNPELLEAQDEKDN